jgi:hypothetical protein
MLGFSKCALKGVQTVLKIPLTLSSLQIPIASDQRVATLAGRGKVPDGMFYALT